MFVYFLNGPRKYKILVSIIQFMYIFYNIAECIHRFRFLILFYIDADAIRLSYIAVSKAKVCTVSNRSLNVEELHGNDSTRFPCHDNDHKETVCFCRFAVYFRRKLVWYISQQTFWKRDSCFIYCLDLRHIVSGIWEFSVYFILCLLINNVSQFPYDYDFGNSLYFALFYEEMCLEFRKTYIVFQIY